MATLKKPAVTITAQPKDYTGAVGTNAKFTVTASGTNLSYQWQYNAGSGWKNSTWASAQSSALSFPITLARDGQQYRCIVTADGGSVTSAAAVLKVKPQITAQPASVKAASGSMAKFTVTASGTGLSYQWQYSKDGTTWADTTWNGAKTATLNVPAAAERNGYKYRCIVTSSNGTSVTTSAATLTCTG